MIKAKIDSCIKLTERILTDHYRKQHELFTKHLHKNCLWIGSNANEYYHGKEMITFILSQDQEEMPNITLSSKEFECITHERNTCVIVGRYIGIIDNNENEIFRDMQRVTFVWKEENDKLLICHMHVSNPLTLVKNDEVFPHQLSAHTKEYIDMLKEKEIDRSGCLVIKDEYNTIQKIFISEITYIEGFDANTIIHTIYGDILAKSLLADIERQIVSQGSNLIIRVHRSHMVNKFFVNYIKRYELGVAKKYKVPVSKQKYLRLKEELFVNEGEKANE